MPDEKYLEMCSYLSEHNQYIEVEGKRLKTLRGEVNKLREVDTEEFKKLNKELCSLEDSLKEVKKSVTAYKALVESYPIYAETESN